MILYWFSSAFLDILKIKLLLEPLTLPFFIHINIFENFASLMNWRWSWIVFVEWLTHERRLALFPLLLLRHSANRIWTCLEPEFRLQWMKLCSNDTTTPQCQKLSQFIQLYLFNKIKFMEEFGRKSSLKAL